MSAISAQPRRLHRDIARFADAHAGCRERFHQQAKPLPAQSAGRRIQAVILAARQLPARLPKQPALYPQEPHPAPVPAQKAEQAVHGRQHGVDGRRRVTGRHQAGFPFRGQLLCHFPPVQPTGKRAHRPAVLFDRFRAFFLLAHGVAVRCQALRRQFVSHDTLPLFHLKKNPARRNLSFASTIVPPGNPPAADSFRTASCCSGLPGTCRRAANRHMLRDVSLAQAAHPNSSLAPPKRRTSRTCLLCRFGISVSCRFLPQVCFHVRSEHSLIIPLAGRHIPFHDNCHIMKSVRNQVSFTISAGRSQSFDERILPKSTLTRRRPSFACPMAALPLPFTRMKKGSSLHGLRGKELIDLRGD